MNWQTMYVFKRGNKIMAFDKLLWLNCESNKRRKI